LTKRNPERANAYTEAAKALHPSISQSQSRIDELVAKQTALEAYLGKVSEFAKLKEQRTAALTEQARLASKPEGSNYNIHAAVRSGQLSGKVGELTARMEDLKREGEQHANLVYDLYTTPPVSNSEPAPG
jgi:hypothetical protein